MFKSYLRIVPVALCALLFISCAKDIDEDTNEIQNRVLDSWVKVNYGSSVKKTESGAYILNSTQGSGASVGSDTSYVFVSFTTKKLDGTIVTTTDKALAQQLGTYATNSYYGSAVWRLGIGAIYPGIEDVLKDMKVGGTTTIALPIAATVIDYSLYNEFSSSGETENIIYELRLDNVVEDIYKYQKDLLKEYSKKYFGSMDSISEGFYMKKTLEKEEADTISESSTIKVNYVGKLLDGYTFDTNIQDTAKKYRFYSSSNTYSELEITFNESKTTLEEENSIVGGFAEALTHMRYGESAIAFFWSPLGYKESGQSGTIPGYAPLYFMISVNSKN